MSLIVQKFGGSSVANLERIQNVARIVADTKAKGHQVVVVVSAMLGETDRWIELARHLSAENDREYDALIATGEQVSAALLSLALTGLGYPAASYNGTQIRILTTDEHKKARILNIETEALQAELAASRIPVITGFQGVTEAGAITTLGRGGSDLTAVAIAAALDADECEIYTDVDGVYTSDPRIVPDARRLSRVEFGEMMEMASLGAKVLQNRCLEFAGKYKVPVRVLSSLQAGGGTLVDFEEKLPQEPLVSGVALDRNQAKITLQGIPERPGLASYILGPLSQRGIEVDMIVQNLPSAEGLIDFSFTVNRDDYEATQQLMQAVAQEVSAQGVVASATVAKLSLVGVGMRSHASVASTMFSALGREGIDIYLITSSEIKISTLIDDKFAEMGARVLHQAFKLSLCA